VSQYVIPTPIDNGRTEEEGLSTAWPSLLSGLSPMWQVIFGCCLFSACTLIRESYRRTTVCALWPSPTSWSLVLVRVSKYFRENGSCYEIAGAFLREQNWLVRYDMQHRRSITAKLVDSFISLASFDSQGSMNHPRTCGRDVL
jgi:hypothetical protein